MAEVMYWPKELALATLEEAGGLADWNHPRRHPQGPRSVVAVIEGYALYTEKELERLAWFSEQMTHSYKKHWDDTGGANILRVTKDTSGGGKPIWWARKLTWRQSVPFDSLRELMQRFRQDGEYTL